MSKENNYNAYQLGPSAAVTGATSGNTTVPVIITNAAAIAFVLRVTASEDDADDTLNVFIQTMLDGTNWLDIAHFTEQLGNTDVSTPDSHILKVVRDLATAEFEIATALGEGAVRNLLGKEFRARWVTVDPTGTDASFTFSVQAIPM